MKYGTIIILESSVSNQQRSKIVAEGVVIVKKLQANNYHLVLDWAVRMVIELIIKKKSN